MLYQQPSLPPIEELPEQDRQVLRDLLDLLTENEAGSGRRRFTGRLPSQASPSFSLFPTIQIFFDKTCRDIKRLRLDKPRQNNLSRGEKLALKSLKNNDSFEIKEADKGGNIPLAQRLDSFVRDTTHLLLLLKDLEIPDGTILVTLDVEALYTNISHNLVRWIFFDLRIGICHNRTTTTLFRKQTATNNVLHFDSFHPAHLRKGIPKGQFIRIRRNCSRTEDFMRESRQLSNRFRERGYPRKIISGAFEFSRNRPREEFLTPWVRDARNRISLITRFHNQWSDVYQILGNNWGILLSDSKLQRFVDERPSVVARRTQNLKDILSNSHFRRPTTKIRTGNDNKGTFPCGACSICPRILSNRLISVLCLPTQIQPKAYINCRSRNIVYALVCECKKIYVGQTTQELRRRTQQHLSNIMTARSDRVYLLLLQISYVFFNFLKTSSSSSADGTSEGEEQEQRSQVPVVIRNVPQRDEDVYLDNEQLISLVQERSPLWDSRDRLYKDNVVTRRLWNEVAAALMDGWDSATASSKKAFSEYFPALYCAAVTVVLDGTVGFRARRILAGNPTVSSGSTVTALSIVLLHCAAVTVVLDGTVGFRARRILAGNPTVSSGSTVTALSIVLLHCAAVTVVLDGTVGFRARRILAGNPTVSSGSTVTALSIVLLHCAAVTVVLDGTVGFRAGRILAGNPTVSSESTVTALSIVLLHCAAVTVVLDGTVGFRARCILAGNPTVSSGSTVTALSIVLLHCAAVTVVLDGTVGFRARCILAGNPTVSSGSTVTALSIVLLHCAAVTVVLDGTVGFRARFILAGNPTVSSGSTVTALSIVLLHCAAVTVVLDGTVGFRARCILAGNPTVSSGSTVTALSIVLLHCAAVTVVLDGTVGFRARCILAGNPTVSSGSTVTALSIVLLHCAAVTVVLDGTVFFYQQWTKSEHVGVRSRTASTVMFVLRARFAVDLRQGPELDTVTITRCSS
ncbi:uncharacterized protein [Dendrobates tinctorius]|uniref:uncharacterized protein n=1 Tax=Dendrobates tinctorius TaxID=92724 RepID=UPI003CC939C0